MRRSPFVYSMTRWIAHLVFSIFYRMKVEIDTAFPLQGPIVILPKHQYWTDIPIMSIGSQSLLYFVAKSELFKYPLIRNYLVLLGGIPVDRQQSIRTLSSFRYLRSLLKAGEKIVIFPEGTYFRGEVGLGKDRLIQMILSLQTELAYKIPFIPVGIHYGGRIGWRRQVDIRMGYPLFAEKESEASLLVQRVMKEVCRLSRLPRSNADCGIQNAE